jgi:drug/metabolite transporter (DMT)-like permease
MGQPAQSRRRGQYATAALVGVTLLWGISFPWTKSWQEAATGSPGGPLLAGLTLIALRMPLALVLLGLTRPSLLAAPTRREHAAGALIGLIFWAGFVLQTWGMAWTTPALSAFFTSVCSAWVPVVAWVCWRETSPWLTVVGLGVGLAGCAVLVRGGWALGPGELLTLAASLIFAFQVLFLDRLGRRVNAAYISAGFFGATALLSLAGAVVVAAAGPGMAAWGDWTARMLADASTARVVFLQAALATALAFYLMNTYQPLVPPSRAALIYLLEPVFASIASVWMEYDRVTPPLLVGGALILIGNAVVELPRMLRGRANQPGGSDALPVG